MFAFKKDQDFVYSLTSPPGTSFGLHAFTAMSTGADYARVSSQEVSFESAKIVPPGAGPSSGGGLIVIMSASPSVGPMGRLALTVAAFPSPPMLLEANAAQNNGGSKIGIVERLKRFFGPEGPIFGRHKKGIFNRWDYFRIGWTWNGTAENGRNVSQLRIGSKRQDFHYHWPNYD